MLIAGLVLAALTGCLLAAFVTQASLWAFGVVILAAVWPFVNRPVEGPVIWHLPSERGVTVSDLLALLCFLLGLLLLRHARRVGSS